jgi:hypothetical protein
MPYIFSASFVIWRSTKILSGKEAGEAKQSEKFEAKLVFRFRLSMRKLSETDPISLLFASKRKKYLSKTGAPYDGA